MHHIKPNERTLHGYFSRSLPPILTIQPGETVRYSLLDASWRSVDEKGELQRSLLRDRDPLQGHALCGPIAIEGAKQGMTLAVEIGDMRVASKGWNIGGGPPDTPFERLGVSRPKAEGPYTVYWDLDPEAGTGRNHLGQTVKLAPFLGVLGMPPDGDSEDHYFSTRPPRNCGGNIDCKLLVPGSTLYLPITVDGALFSAGDGHAAQGDGEVSGTAIECPIEQADLTFRLLDDMPIDVPRANTPSGWITLGFHRDLNEATFIALNAMLDLLVEQFDMSRMDALSLASVVVDLHVTQIVNDVQGVHALLPHDAVMLGA